MLRVFQYTGAVPLDLEAGSVKIALFPGQVIEIDSKDEERINLLLRSTSSVIERTAHKPVKKSKPKAAPKFEFPEPTPEPEPESEPEYSGKRRKRR